MPRAKTVVPGRAKRKKVIKAAKGNFSGRRKLYKSALQTMQRSGQFAYVPDGGGPRVVGALQQSDDELLKVIKVNDWNQAHVIARGNMIAEILNGHVTSTLVDDDVKARALKGLLGFQIHVGEPMKVEFRNIWLKQN